MLVEQSSPPASLFGRVKDSSSIMQESVILARDMQQLIAEPDQTFVNAVHWNNTVIPSKSLFG